MLVFPPFPRLIGSHCQPRWLPEASYLRAVQGFLQSGPQLVLQTVVVAKGVVIHSLRDVLKQVLDEGGLTWEFFNGEGSFNFNVSCRNPLIGN